MDYSDLESYIKIDKTVEVFGIPKTIASKIVAICQSCGGDRHTTIKILRSYIRDNKLTLCLKCVSNKRKETSKNIKLEYWKDPEKKKARSELSLKMWQDPEFHGKVSLSVKKTFQNPELIDLVKENASKKWKDPSYIDKTLEAIHKKNQDPEYKDNHSKASKKLWEDPGFRNRITNSNVSTWSDSELIKNNRDIAIKLWQNHEYRDSVINKLLELREIISARSKMLWEDPNFRLRQTEIRKEFSSNEEIKHKISVKSKERWNDSVYRERMISLLNERVKDPEYRKKLSQSSKLLWDNDDYRKKVIQSQVDWLQSGKDSFIERTTQELLSALNIQWERHHKVGYFEFDLFIPSHNLLIECQGEYWHSSDEQKNRDAAKFTYINKYFPDLRILYLYERDFLNPGIVKQKLVRELFEREYKEDQIDFDFKSLEIRLLDQKVKMDHSFYSEPEEFLQSFHYAGYGRSAKKVYGAFLNNKLIAVCKFAGIVRKEVASSINLFSSQVFELDRFCIHPQYQKKNFASWMISRCAKLVFEGFPRIECLVSFADSTFGHSGTIYKASNWIEVHKTAPSYHYMSSDGIVIHKKTLWNKAKKMSRSESEYAEEHSYIKVWGKEKTKFILKRN